MDQNELAPDVVVSGTVWELVPQVRDVMKGYRQGKWIGNIYVNNYGAKSLIYTMKDGAAKLAPYHGFEDKLPKEVKDEVKKAKEDIIAGKLEVPNIWTWDPETWR